MVVCNVCIKVNVGFLFCSVIDLFTLDHSYIFHNTNKTDVILSKIVSLQKLLLPYSHKNVNRAMGTFTSKILTFPCRNIQYKEPYWGFICKETSMYTVFLVRFIPFVYLYKNSLQIFVIWLGLFIIIV